MDVSKAHVLVVDDDPTLLTLLVDTLQAIGYGVTGAQGGIAALDELKHQPFDLMVTDIRMPDLDGIQLLKKVRRHYPAMPVLFITAYASQDIIGRASPDGFLAKPFRIAHIEELIERTLQRKNVRHGRTVRKVLVVDRDDRFRSFLTEALNFNDYIPFAVPDETAAMAELENGTFDAIIADITDPDLEGMKMSEKIREKFPRTPIIAIGGEGPTSPLTTAVSPAHRFAGYLRKPFSLSSFLEMLDKVAPLVL